MGIDWVTFIAQIVNLFILVWLLKKFLYHPILNAIDRRQAQIAERVRSAKEASDKAAREYQAYLDKTEAFDKNTEKMFDEVTQKVTRYQQQEEDKIQKQMIALREKMQSDLQREKENLQLAMRNQMVHSFSLVARKVMTDLSGITPIEQASILFMDKVKKLDKKQLNSIKNTLKNQKDITLYSSDTLTKEMQEKIVFFLRRQLGVTETQKVHIQKNPDLILGLALQVGDLSIDWNIKSYFEEFDANLNATLSGIMA